MLALLPCQSIAQDAAKKTAPSKKTTRQFTPPPKVEGYVIDPVIAEDRGCMIDLLRAKSEEGVAARKRLEELVRYGCIRSLTGIFHATSRESESVTIGDKKIPIRRMIIIVDPEMEKLALGKALDFNSDSFAEGWIIDSTLFRLSSEDFRALLEKQKADPK